MSGMVRTGRWSWALTVSWTILCFKFKQLVLWALSLWLCSLQLLKELVCGVHKLLCTDEVPTTLTLLFWWWLTKSAVFAGRIDGTSYS